MATGETLPMLDKKPLLILMDAAAMLHRAWHAIQQPLNVSRTGEDVRGVFGFLNTFLRSLADWQPTHCAIAFDLPAPTFRHKQFSEYKAHRPATPPELRPQFGRLRDVMHAFGVPVFEHEDYEADDVLGTLCREAEAHQIEALILTGDTDTLQLVSPWVRVLMSFSIQKRMVYDEAAVRERYGGLGPSAVPDIKALEGDTSDNIPGVPGVGSKTAIRLLSEFGSLEGIYENLDKVGPAKAQQSLAENKESALQGKSLATIVRDVPMQFDLEDARFWTYDRATVVEALRELEFFSMVPRIPEPEQDGARATQAELPIVEDQIETEYKIVDTPEALAELTAQLDSAQGFSFDTETTDTNPKAADLVGLSFSHSTGQGWYVPVGHSEGAQLPLDLVLSSVGPILENDQVPKVGHNANYDMTVLSKYGVQVNNLAFDTMLAAHLSGRKAISLEALALDSLNREMTPISDVTGIGRKRITMAQVLIAEAAAYAAAKADVTLQLRDILLKEAENKGVTEVFKTVEMPLVPVLARMQANGTAVDVGPLEQMSAELGEQLSRIEADMYEVVGHEFNLNSPQQLGDVLFKELRLPPTKRTQKGFSTDASSLEGLKQVIEKGDKDNVDPKAVQVLDTALEYRQLAKIKSTYTDALPTLVNPKTGRVHTIYGQTGSATGRVSSNDPNVQNIPVRTELGRRVRKAFVAQNAPEWTLLAADYSQIELRVLAHLSRDPGLLEAFHSGQDIHDATASSVYSVPLSEVDRDMRRTAKIMNFGVIYGLSAFGITRQTGLSPEEGKAFIETYFGQYPGIRQYVESTKAQVRESGYVQTITGRRRYIPEIKSSNFNVRSAGERMAINMPIQGTAADILKIAMVRVQARLDAADLRTMMIIQVHDELIFEAPREELEELKAIVLEVMPAALELAVPLDIELKTGDTWGDME